MCGSYQVSCFADDTGLEVEALGGAPGVYSARYAGPQRSDSDNILLLLQNLAPHQNRRARFRTCITLILDGQQHQFPGEPADVVERLQIPLDPQAGRCRARHLGGQGVGLGLGRLQRVRRRSQRFGRRR